MTFVLGSSLIALACGGAARDLTADSGDLGQAGASEAGASQGGALPVSIGGRGGGGSGSEDIGGEPPDIGAGEGGELERGSGGDAGSIEAAGGTGPIGGASNGVGGSGTAGTKPSSGGGSAGSAPAITYCDLYKGTASSTLLCEDFEGDTPSPTLWNATPAGFTIDTVKFDGAHGLRIEGATNYLTAKLAHLPDPAHISFWARIDPDATQFGGDLMRVIVDDDSALPVGLRATYFAVEWSDLSPNGSAFYSPPPVPAPSNVWTCYDLTMTSKGQLTAKIYDYGHTLLGTVSIDAASLFGAEAGNPLRTLGFGFQASSAGGLTWIDNILVSTDTTSAGSACAP